MPAALPLPGGDMLPPAAGDAVRFSHAPLAPDALRTQLRAALADEERAAVSLRRAREHLGTSSELLERVLSLNAGSAVDEGTWRGALTQTTWWIASRSRDMARRAAQRGVGSTPRTWSRRGRKSGCLRHSETQRTGLYRCGG